MDTPPYEPHHTVCILQAGAEGAEARTYEAEVNSVMLCGQRVHTPLPVRHALHTYAASYR